jgi:hypothetical protein
MRRRKAVQPPVQLGIGVEFIHQAQLAVAPRSSFRQYAFDESPGTLKLLRCEVLRRRPAPTRSRISCKVLGIDVVSAMRPTNGSESSRPDVQAKRLDVAAKTASGSVEFHEFHRESFNSPGRFKVSRTSLKGDCIYVKRHAPRWRALASPRRQPGVRLGPRYPRDTSVLEVAPPRIAPMSELQFARAVEILAEMLADRTHEGDSPSAKSVIRRVHG